MSADANMNAESRITELEIRLRQLLDFVKDLDALVRDASQKALQSGQGGGGGNIGNPLLFAFTPSGGIPCATVSGTAPTLTIIPGSALCWVFRVSGTGTTYVGQFDVYNPYTSGTSTAIGATSQKLIPVIQDESQNLWAIGEPCP